MERIIKTGTKPGGIVLDPFMGSGTTAVAAKKLLRHYIGYDTNREYIKIAEERIKNIEEPFQGELF
jgi:DNA modification methylase